MAWVRLKLMARTRKVSWNPNEPSQVSAVSHTPKNFLKTLNGTPCKALPLAHPTAGAANLKARSDKH